MKRLLIIGSGKRVREAALPALHRAAQRFSVRRVFARTEKTIGVEDRSYRVEPLAALDAKTLADADLVYVAVGKDAVPKVLAHLVALDVSKVDLLIDTPVVRFKHFRHTALLAHFRNAWVAEDCAYLPWFDTVREACAPNADSPIGPLTHAVFHRSAYAYHGLASAKTLFGSASIASGRRKRFGDGAARRELVLADGMHVEIVEPRDYSVGYVELEGERGTASDRMTDSQAHAKRGSANPIPIEVILENGSCRGFRIGAIETHLSPEESDLTRGLPDHATLTARMESMKRVGFLRLLRAIDEGRGAYPIESGIEDMVVDYYLEKFGMWRSTPLTSPRSRLGRGLLNAVSRVGG